MPFGGGPLPNSSQLDGPPPPPGADGKGPTDGGSPTFEGLGGPMPAPSMTSADLPPEILTGIVAAGQKISAMFDSFAQVTPDLAMDWDLCKTVLNKAIGKVLVAGGGPSSPTATGGQFPGGGIDKGLPQQGV